MQREDTGINSAGDNAGTSNNCSQYAKKCSRDSVSKLEFVRYFPERQKLQFLQVFTFWMQVSFTLTGLNKSLFRNFILIKTSGSLILIFSYCRSLTLKLFLGTFFFFPWLGSQKNRCCGKKDGLVFIRKRKGGAFSESPREHGEEWKEKKLEKKCQ